MSKFKFTHKIVRQRMDALDLALHGHIESDRAEKVLNAWAKFMVVLAREMRGTAKAASEKKQWEQVRESAQEWLDWEPLLRK